MALFALPFVLGVAACGGSERPVASPPPRASTLCLTGGLVPAEESMEDYGTTYTPGLEGPAPAAPPRHVAKCNDTPGPRAEPRGPQ
jgi:hypothetical protein